MFVDAVEENLHFHMTYFAKFLPSMEVIEEPDVTLALCTVPSDTFNRIFGARFASETCQLRIREIVELFRRRRLPFAWWTGPSDEPRDLQEQLRACGLAAKAEEVGMYKEINQEADQDLLEIKHVTTPEYLKVFADVAESEGEHSAAYETVYKPLPPESYGPGAPIELYLGCAAGVPVVTGQLVFHAGTAGIYYIITHPDHRRKGYAMAMMQSLLHRSAALGYSLAVLQATFQGKTVYEKLGFSECCRFVEYS